MTNINLIYQLTKHDLSLKYKGTILGRLWSFFNPLIMLSIYTFVFSSVFKSRWTGLDSNSNTDYALIIFIGMILHGFFAENISRATSLIRGNVNYVKKIVFPLPILSVVVLISTLVQAGINLLIWFLFFVFFRHLPPITALYFPLVLVPLVFLTLGVSWFIASISVYFKDFEQIIGVVISILFFMSPIFYPIDIIPVKYQFFLYMNPLTYFIETARAVLIWGKSPDWILLIVVYIACAIFCYAGYKWFNKVKKGFADVL